MATFRVTPATSVVTSANAVYAFSSDSLGADTLIVDPGAFLISTAFNSGGASLANTGGWTVTVNGSIFTHGNSGLYLEPGNTAVSTITIGADGAVGGSIGITAASAATIKNAGVISGEFGIVIFNGGVHTITNSGTVSGAAYSIKVNGLGIVKVTNSGTLDGNVDLGYGDATLTNSGTIAGFVALASGTNKLTNSGTIEDGVLSSDSNDVFWNYATDASGITRSGTVNFVIGMGSGDDKFFGGSNAEIVQDDAGSDIVKLGGGNDTYNAICNSLGDGTDAVDGGIGIDTYNAANATSWVAINLDTVAHDLSPISGNGDVAARTALGDAIAGAFKDTITGFENAVGGSAGDILYGNAAANRLDGGGSGDNLLGYGGNDTLLGGDGADGLAGGAGKDTLTGGSEGDFFQYFATTDSGVTSATRDVITDFQDGVDKIDLFFIDANTTNGAATNDAFTFIGTNVAFGGTPGQLRAYWTGSGQIIAGDVNGDKVADFSIGVTDDPWHSLNFAGDFLL